MELNESTQPILTAVLVVLLIISAYAGVVIRCRPARPSKADRANAAAARAAARERKRLAAAAPTTLAGSNSTQARQLRRRRRAGKDEGVDKCIDDTSRREASDLPVSAEAEAETQAEAEAQAGTPAVTQAGGKASEGNFAAKPIDCAASMSVLSDPASSTATQVMILQEILDLLAKCQAPEHRGANKQAELCNSVLQCDGLHVLRALQDTSPDPKVAALAGQLLEKVATMLWAY